VLKLFSEILHVKSIQVQDNFFELGGHSLLVTRLIAKLRHEFKMKLTYSTIFQTPTAQALASVIEDRLQLPEAAHPPISLSLTSSTSTTQSVMAIGATVDDGEDTYNFTTSSLHHPHPVTSAQSSLWFAANVNVASFSQQAYNVILAMHVSAVDIKINLLRAAWQSVLDASPSLRTTYELGSKGEVLQVVHEKQVVDFEE